MQTMTQQELFDDPKPVAFDDPVPQELEANYAAHLTLQWINGDPGLHERCLGTARHWARKRHRSKKVEERTDMSPEDRFADELRIKVVTDALAVERNGLFYDLFTEGLREIMWSELAAF
ncbi:MAG TPA: hypothetical protein VHR66_30925 [Gemmataceae bacterium]|jgi:hypothetical protein|nr:hypothetical protein [Gemmataceae bacterium]